MRRLLLFLMLLSPLLGRSQAQIKIDTINGASTFLLNSSTSQVQFYHTIVKNYSTVYTFNDTLRIYVAVLDALNQPQVMDIVDAGFRNIDTLGSVNDTVDIDTSHVTVNPAFFMEGNNTVVIWPACSGTFTIDTFTVDVWFVSVEELFNDDINIKLGPNPASDHIVLGDPDNVVKQVRIRSLDGRLLGTGSTNTILQLNGFSDGLYLVELQTADNRVYTRKLIVKR